MDNDVSSKTIKRNYTKMIKILETQMLALQK